MTITTAQIRGARGLLNWTQQDLSERTDISATSIGAIENGQTMPRESTLQAFRKAFEDAGIEFSDNQGVRFRTAGVRTLSGRNGYLEFFEDVYLTLEQIDKPQVLVSNVDERQFEYWHGKYGGDHVNKIKNDLKADYKILVREGDTYFPASDYAEYRWLSTKLFVSVPFYLYGQKLAIILFENEPKIILIESPLVAEAYRVQFENMWADSLTPSMKKEASKR